MLVKYKFKNWTHRKRTGEVITPEEREKRAAEIADKLSKHNTWLTHARSIKIDDLRAMELMVTDYSENPDLADAIRRYKILLQLTFERTPAYKIYETPTSQIVSQVNMQGIVPPGMVPQAMPGIPKDAKTLEMDFDCNTCHTITKLQARFSKTVPMKPDYIPFPITNKFICKGCGKEHDLTNVRRDIERQFGKKIVS